MLAAALHLVRGPRAARRRAERADPGNRPRWALKAPGLRHGSPPWSTTSPPAGRPHSRPAHRCPCSKSTTSTAGSTPAGPPTTRCCRSPPGSLARQAGYSQFWTQMDAHPAPTAVDTLNAVGVEKIVRPQRRTRIPTADSTTTLPWTLPLHRSEAVARDRHRPHRSHRRPGRGIGDAGQRADGATRRLPPPDRGTDPRHEALSHRQQNRQRSAPRRHRRPMGRHRTGPTALSNSSSNCTRTPANGALLWSASAFGSAIGGSAPGSTPQRAPVSDLLRSPKNR